MDEKGAMEKVVRGTMEKVSGEGAMEKVPGGRWSQGGEGDDGEGK